jgi:hypothetical protein
MPIETRPRPLRPILTHCDPSALCRNPSALIATRLRPFAFRPHVEQEVCAQRMRSVPAWVQYKRRGAIAGEATISLPLLHGLDLSTELLA